MQKQIYDQPLKYAYHTLRISDNNGNTIEIDLYQTIRQTLLMLSDKSADYDELPDECVCVCKHFYDEPDNKNLRYMSDHDYQSLLSIFKLLKDTAFVSSNKFIKYDNGYYKCDRAFIMHTSEVDVKYTEILLDVIEHYKSECYFGIKIYNIDGYADKEIYNTYREQHISIADILDNTVQIDCILRVVIKANVNIFILQQNLRYILLVNAQRNDYHYLPDKYGFGVDKLTGIDLIGNHQHLNDGDLKISIYNKFKKMIDNLKNETFYTYYVDGKLQLILHESEVPANMSYIQHQCITAFSWFGMHFKVLNYSVGESLKYQYYAG